MKRRTQGRSVWSPSRVLPVLAVVLAPVLAGCAGTDAGKAGAAQPVTLTFGDLYSVLPEYEPAVQAFVNDVRRRSGGLLAIDVRHFVGGKGPDLEQQTVRSVAAGKLDLAWTGTRVYDTLGVGELQALTAPLLVDSVPLEKAVLSGDLPARMLPALDRVGVKGLALLAGGLRRPIAVKTPLLSVRDWQGVTFETFRSRAAAATVEALGAIPTDVVFDAADAGLSNGAIGGLEKNLAIYRVNGTYEHVPYVTANVVLWPETAALLASPSTWQRLTDRQRGWLQEAARQASAESAGLVDVDQGLVPLLCAQGARFAWATAAGVRGMTDAVAPVYRTLEQDLFTSAAIAEIRRLKASMPAPNPLAVDAGCGGKAPAPGSTADPDAAALLVGTWRTDPIPKEHLRAMARKAATSERDAEDYVTQLPATTSDQFELELGAGKLSEYEIADGGPRELGWVGTYTVEGSTIHAVDRDALCHIDFRWTLNAGMLALKVLRDVGDSPLCGPGDLLAQRVGVETAPFHKVS